MIRVLIADDHAVVRQGLRTFLDLQADIDVVGEAADGEEAVAAAAEHAPDVILLDLVMPVLDGIGALRRLREAAPGVARDRAHQLRRGRAAVHRAARGRDRLPAQGRRAGRARARRSAPRTPARRRCRPRSRRAWSRSWRRGGARGAPADELTPRELEVLCLIARGRSNKRIALELGVAEKTVKTHVSHVLAKLGLSDRTQAALYAVREGLVSPGS